MQTILSLVIEVGFVALTVVFIQFVVLLFRNEQRAEWLRHGITEYFAVMAIVTSVTLSLATLVSGLIDAGLNVFASLVVSAILPIAIGYFTDRLFRVRERLRRAETGASPFAPISEGLPYIDPARRKHG